MKWYLFRYNKITGYWEKEREVSADTGQEWLGIFEKDEPTEYFWVSKRWPQHNPTKHKDI